MTTSEDLANDFAEAIEGSMGRLMSDSSVDARLKAEGFDPGAWETAVEGGWLDVLVPEEDGGLGLGFGELAPVLFATGRRLLGGPIAERAIAIPFLSAATGPAVARLDRSPSFVPALVDPHATGAPDSSLGRVGSTLDGSLAAVRFAAVASHLIVVVNDVDEGPQILLIEVDRDGVSVERDESFDPYSGHSSVSFEKVELGPEDLIAAGAEAVELLGRLRDGMRLGIAFEIAGMADHVLSAAVAYAGEREQFGRPIGAFQAIQQILGDMVVDSRTTLSVCLEGARQVDRDAASLPVIAAVAKTYATSRGRTVIESGLQVHGGIAFTLEFGLGRYYVHALALEGAYGLNDTLYRALGDQLLSVGLDELQDSPAWQI